MPPLLLIIITLACIRVHLQHKLSIDQGWIQIHGDPERKKKPVLPVTGFGELGVPLLGSC